MIDPQVEQAARQWTLAQPAVSAFVASQVHDVRQVEDILQDVAVAVIENIDSYDSDLPFKSWAIGIARNQIRNYFRSKKNKPLLFDSDTVENLAIAYQSVAAETNESLGYLKECIETLEGKAKTICELRYCKDLKPAAIARQFDMNANAVSKALQRIRESLRRCITQKALARGAQ